LEGKVIVTDLYSSLRGIERETSQTGGVYASYDTGSVT